MNKPTQIIVLLVWNERMHTTDWRMKNICTSNMNEIKPSLQVRTACNSQKLTNVKFVGRDQQFINQTRIEG